MRGTTAPAIQTVAVLAITMLLLAGCGSASAPSATEPGPGSEASSPAPVPSEPVDQATPIGGSGIHPNGEAIPLDGDFFHWDADGDGTPEACSVTHWRNGDEAPDVIDIEIRLGDGTTLTATLDNAYEIVELWSATDGPGLPVLEVTYTTGDYYSHERTDCRIIQLVDGELVVSQLVTLDGDGGEA